MAEQPRFELFRNVPDSVAATPPLASGLQSFENSIMLVGLGRFPAALTACGTALESTVRAISGYHAMSSVNGLNDAIQFVTQKKPKLRIPKLNEFRNARNDFTHQGYSPKDDERAMTLLFGVGYPFLSQCLWEFHEFSLRDTLINGLWDQIEIARAVLKEIEGSVRPSLDGTNLQLISPARALQHEVLISFPNPMDGRWSDVDHGLPDHEWKARENSKSDLESKWGFYTYVDCPIHGCQSSDCCVALDEQNKTKLVPTALRCFDCRFTLGIHDTTLMKHLIGEQLDNSRKEVLREYGLAP